jgi:hypothetical protein
VAWTFADLRGGSTLAPGGGVRKPTIASLSTAAALLVIFVVQERADARPRPFPTFGGGIVSTTADEGAHGYLWAGIAVRPGRDDSGRFAALAMDIEFHDGVATVVPNVRVGWTGFVERDSWLPLVTTYLIAGYGTQDVEGRVQNVFRVGSGLCLPYLLRAAEYGLAIPTTIEWTLDMGTADTTATFRVGWGF